MDNNYEIKCPGLLLNVAKRLSYKKQVDPTFINSCDFCSMTRLLTVWFPINYVVAEFCMSHTYRIPACVPDVMAGTVLSALRTDHTFVEATHIPVKAFIT